MSRSQLVLNMREAEEKLRQWLDSNNARYLWHGDDQELPLDCVVYSPFSVGIEIKSVSAPSAEGKRAKRDLFARIDLVDDFGPALPFVVFTVGQDLDRNPFRLMADAVFSLDRLPSFDELRKIRINPEVQDVLKRGAPHDVNVTDQDILEERWSRSLALSEFVDRLDFPEASLAFQIHQVALEILEAQGTGSTTERVPHLNPRIRPTRFDQCDSPPIRLDTLLKRRDFSQAIEDLVIRQAINAVGGKIETQRVTLSSKNSNLLTVQQPIWQLNNGRQIVLRRLAMSDMFIDHKVRELIAEAWLLRAADSLLKPHLYLLLTDTRRDLPKPTLYGPRPSTISKGLIKCINRFESAGWRVFPWDFAEQEPAFISMARALSEEGR